MSSSDLQKWLKNNLKALPAIPLYAQQAKNIVSEEDFEKLALSQIIASDPGLSSQLFNLVNAKRKNTKREYIESVLSALTLMGDPSIIKFVENMSSLDDIRTSFECENDYLKLIARAQQAAKHAKQWAETRHSQGIKEIGSATRLYDIAEFVFCLFDHEQYKQFLLKNLNEYNPDKHYKELLGFDRHDLSLALCDHFHLPSLILEAHNRENIKGIRSQGIQIASELMHHADLNWYSETTLNYLTKAADLCQISIDKMSSMAHITCVESAQELEFDVKFHSAANLVQHKAPLRPQQVNKTIKQTTVSDKKTPDVVVKKPTALAPSISNPILTELKETAQNIKTSQATQLNALLDGCHKHLKISRNALFLLNQDRSKISTRLHKGLDNDSALLKFNIAIQQSGLLKVLLEKPQAIWINPDNFRKYEKMLPGLFKSCCLNDDLFMMSLFSGNKPVGIVFCDNYGQSASLDKTQFSLFKQAVGLTSKAMLLISQRQKKKLATT